MCNNIKCTWNKLQLTKIIKNRNDRCYNKKRKFCKENVYFHFVLLNWDTENKMRY